MFKDLSTSSQNALKNKKFEYGSDSGAVKNFQFTKENNNFKSYETDDIQQGAFGYKYHYTPARAALNKEYGQGDKEKNFVWNNYYRKRLDLVDDIPAGEDGLTYKYSDENLQSRVFNDSNIIDEDIIGNYVDNQRVNNGGAVYNNNGAQIRNIQGDFINNSVFDYGGAVYNNNSSFIQNIEGSYVGNEAYNGGAIFNDRNSQINDIKGDFIGNIAYRQGGAIYNNASSHIHNIEGNFIGNYALYGGAIDNEFSAVVNSITGNFIRNSSQEGGAINNSNNAVINEITGDFIENSSTVYGSAIWNNESEINKVTGNFIGNYTDSYGGAIGNYSDGYIGNLSGYFIDNHSNEYGGAIYNRNSTIDTINGDFVNNKAYYGGGAIYNNYNSTINTINGNFIGNSSDRNGGGIYNNDSTIHTINGDFIGNNGGAVYNYYGSTIDAINGDFIGNFSKNFGGAISNTDTSSIGTITGDFIANGSESFGGAIFNDKNSVIVSILNSNFYENNSNANGGAIYTNNSISIVASGAVSEFTGNTANGINEAIYVNDSDAVLTLKAVNKGKILFNDKINGVDGYKISLTGDDASSVVELNDDIMNADVTLDKITLKLGASENTDGISTIFETSSLTVSDNGVVDTLDGKSVDYKFKELNLTDTNEFALDIDFAEKDKSDKFTVESGSGYINITNFTAQNEVNDEDEYIFQIIKDKSGNGDLQLKIDNNIKVVKTATAHMTSDDILAQEFGLTTTETENDSIKIKGWQDNLAKWAELDESMKTFTINNGDSQMLTRDIESLNGKHILINGTTKNNLDLNGKNLLHEISSKQDVSLSNLVLKNANDINNKGDLTLIDVDLDSSSNINNLNNITIEGKTDINGNITSTAEGNLTFEDAQSVISGSIENQKISIKNSTATLKNIDNFSNNSLSMDSGNFNINNFGINNHLNFVDLELTNGNINLNNVDVDLTDKLMGTVSADNYNGGSGHITLSGFNLHNETGGTIPVYFASENIKDAVTLYEDTVYSPLYKYGVEYSTDGTYGKGGYVVFSRDGGAASGSIESFNPAVVSSPVASQTGGYATVNETFNVAFEHAEAYTSLPSAERTSLKNANKYAITEQGALNYNLNDINANSVWIKPYTAFESIPLKNGPDVDTITYGTIIGGDTPLTDLKNGWQTLSTLYLGYNGANQHYNGISTVQNGGILGLTQTFYKENFYTAITASIGASMGETSNMYGNEDFAMLMSGVASKTGYNFEFKDGKYIIQPSFLLAYTFVKTFDYTNSAGLKINSDPLQALQLRPNVKFIMNTESGWQPYLSAGVVWNILDKTDVTANDVKLPSMSIKPYAEYGIGVQKRWKDKITGYVQAMVRNGGRNGVALTAGIKWTLGKKDNL